MEGQGCTVSLDSLLEGALASSGATSSQDAVVVALHSNLLAAGYQCTATGDEGFGDKTSQDCEPISTCAQPQLPSGWNSSQDVYALQYKHRETKRLCLVKAIPMGVQLLISAVVQSHMDNVLSLTLMPAKYVKDTAAYNTPSIYNNLLELMSILKGELEVKLTQICEATGNLPLLSGGGSLGGSLATGSAAKGLLGPHSDPTMVPPPVLPPTRRPEDDPLRLGPPIRPEVNDPLRIGPPRRPGDLDPLGEVGPFGYGDRDRMPFGGGSGGGGMIFDPFRGGHGGRGELPGLGPRGGGPYPPGHPPGARFDPVGPLRPPLGPRQPGRYPRPQRPPYGPDPDHLPPPGYDDMFS